MTITPIFTHKATKYNPDLHVNKIEGAWVEEKLDGQAIQSTFNNGDIRLYANAKAKVSNQFTEYTEKCPHIVEELKQIEFDNIHLQGEVYSKHLPTSDANCRYTVGVLKDFNSYERQLNEGMCYYTVYDIPSARYSTYEERYRILQDIFDEHSFKYVSLIPILGINENGSWVDYFNEIEKQGKEGVVLYSASAFYAYPKSEHNIKNSSIWKIKTMDEKEVCVIEKIEGTGKFEGTVGKLLAVDGNGKQFLIGTLAVDDTERNYIWNNVECPFIIEMRYMQETEDDYRHAVMTRLRLDKDVDTWNPE